ncbi:hypothetical protein ARMGADRAFT_1082882 [Armillaria gallica]|uniref:Uncharacterized protein n=1 Tax=Armillaria gallica TaxID=47427 RepID=A0A2H3D7A4_ARMGA|nr:hypothetical protein ARMGADRAFT_1082882 [Armillaria gallica]
MHSTTPFHTDLPLSAADFCVVQPSSASRRDFREIARLYKLAPRARPRLYSRRPSHDRPSSTATTPSLRHSSLEQAPSRLSNNSATTSQPQDDILHPVSANLQSPAHALSVRIVTKAGHPHPRTRLFRTHFPSPPTHTQSCWPRNHPPTLLTTSSPRRSL